MAENVPPSGLASLPPPPSNTASAPGQQSYEGVTSNGQMNPHMPPPPLPPVVIPQNNNPIPTAMTSPMSGDILSPTSSGGFVRRAAPEPNKRALYVGGLDPRVTEEVLKQIFETTGHVQSVKIIPDKNVSIGGGRTSCRNWLVEISTNLCEHFFYLASAHHHLRVIPSTQSPPYHISFQADQSVAVPKQRSQLRFRRIRRSRRGGESYVYFERPSGPSVGESDFANFDTYSYSW